VKDVVTTLLGMVLFTGFNATVMSVGGLLISFAGAFTYSSIKLRNQQLASSAAAAKASATGAAGDININGTSGVVVGAPSDQDVGSDPAGVDVESGGPAGVANSSGSGLHTRGGGGGDHGHGSTHTHAQPVEFTRAAYNVSGPGLVKRPGSGSSGSSAGGAGGDLSHGHGSDMTQPLLLKVASPR
jgi:hypothetical protein